MGLGMGIGRGISSGTGYDFSTFGIDLNDLNLAAVTQYFNLVDIGLAFNSKHTSSMTLRSDVHCLLFADALGCRMHNRIQQKN